MRSSSGSETARPRRGERLRPEVRRREIIAAARALFLEEGYAASGMAEVAAVGEVSRASVYRYFPEGRSDLLASVAEELMEELRQRMRQAASVPFSRRQRLDQLLAAMFGYFGETPGAYRLLIRDVWAEQDPQLEAAVLGGRQLLAAEVARVIAGDNFSAREIAIAAASILGAALAAIDATLDHPDHVELAWRLTCRQAGALLED